MNRYGANMKTEQKAASFNKLIYEIINGEKSCLSFPEHLSFDDLYAYSIKNKYIKGFDELEKLDHASVSRFLGMMFSLKYVDYEAIVTLSGQSVSTIKRAVAKGEIIKKNRNTKPAKFDPISVLNWHYNNDSLPASSAKEREKNIFWRMMFIKQTDLPNTLSSTVVNLPPVNIKIVPAFNKILDSITTSEIKYLEGVYLANKTINNKIEQTDEALEIHFAIQRYCRDNETENKSQLEKIIFSLIYPFSWICPTCNSQIGVDISNHLSTINNCINNFAIDNKLIEYENNNKTYGSIEFNKKNSVYYCNQCKKTWRPYFDIDQVNKPNYKIFDLIKKHINTDDDHEAIRIYKKAFNDEKRRLKPENNIVTKTKVAEALNRYPSNICAFVNAIKRKGRYDHVSSVSYLVMRLSNLIMIINSKSRFYYEQTFFEAIESYVNIN